MDVETSEEVRRWRRFVTFVFGELPEVKGWLERGTPRTPGWVWSTLADNALERSYRPTSWDGDFWPRTMRVIEVVEEAFDIVVATPGFDEDDAVTLDSFANAMLLGDLTWNLDVVQRMVPWIGPKGIEGLQAILDRPSRGSAADQVDWSIAGRDFVPLDVNPHSILPLPRRDVARPSE